jgi:hypothetical protein
MPRLPIGDQAMTPAERARRYRARRRASPAAAVDVALQAAERSLRELWSALLAAGAVADTADLRERVDLARKPIHEVGIELIYRKRGNQITAPRERPAA